jgi:hypothetical protein
MIYVFENLHSPASGPLPETAQERPPLGVVAGCHDLRFNDAGEVLY